MKKLAHSLTQNIPLCYLPLALAMASLFSLSAQAADAFADLGTLGGMNNYAFGLSADGSTAVGQANAVTSRISHAFRWTSATGMKDLGTLGGNNSSARAVSADGSTVVGDSDVTNRISHAFRWTNAGMQDIGALTGGNYSSAFGVSADGATVVGYSDIASHLATHAFRWTSAGMQDLGTLDASNTAKNSYAYAISADGATVVGEADSLNIGASHAFRWTSATNMMEDLGTLDPDNNSNVSTSSAYGASADGSTIVGAASIANNSASHAFRWTSATGMKDLGTLGGINSIAFAVSADGNTVVGQANTNPLNYDVLAFRWTPTTGMQSIATWLATAHVTIPTGWSLTNATGVSSDGSVVVGDGTSSDPTHGVWLARVAVIGSGIINVAAFNQSVLNTGSSVTRVGTSLPSLIMDGTHHRTLLDSGLARDLGNGMGAWVTADAAHFNANHSDMEITEVGVYKDIGTARAGLGIGHEWDRQGLNLGGHATYNGQYLMAEVDNMFTSHIEGSITGYYGNFDTKVSRSYVNGASIATSSGNTSTASSSVRVRLDWLDMAKLGQFTFSPYLAYTWSQAHVGAYTEAGGGFPVSYHASTNDNNLVRVGLAGKTALTSTTSLVLNAEAVHSLESNTSGTSGQIIGLSGFAVAGQNIGQDWVRVLADIDHRLSDKSLISVGLNAGTQGGDPSYGATVSYRKSF